MCFLRKYSFSSKKCPDMTDLKKKRNYNTFFSPLNEFSVIGLACSQVKVLLREESLPGPESEFLLNEAKKVLRIQVTRQFLGTVSSFSFVYLSQGYVEQHKSLVLGVMSSCPLTSLRG